MVGTFFALNHKEPVKARAVGATYQLLENLNELSDGDIIVFADQQDQVAMGEAGSKYTGGVEVSINKGKLEDSTGAATQFVVEKGTGNKYSFKTTGDKYLTSNSSSASSHTNGGYLKYIATSGTAKTNYSTYSLALESTNHTVSMTLTSSGTVDSCDRVRYNASNPMDTRFRTYKNNIVTRDLSIFVHITDMKRVTIDTYSHLVNTQVGVGDVLDVSATLESIVATSITWSVNAEAVDKVDLIYQDNECVIEFLAAATDVTLSINVIDGGGGEFVDSVKFDVLDYNYYIDNGNFYLNTIIDGKYVYLNNAFAQSSNDVTSVGLFDDNGLITFEHASKGDNTYYLKYNGYYCAASSSHARFVKTTVKPDTYWTISEDNGQYKLVDHATSKFIAYEASMTNYGKFMCFSGTPQSSNIVWFNISKQWTFVDFVHTDATPDNIVYEVGEEFSSEGMQLDVQFYDPNAETNRTIDITDQYEWTALTSTSVSSTGTVSIAGHNDSVVVSVTMLNYQLDSIAVNASGAKTEYIEGQSVKKTGLVVTATYKAQGAVDKVETLNDNDYTVYPEKVGRNTTKVTISYGGKSTSYDVEVTPNYFIHCEDNDKVRPGHRVIFTNPTYEVEMKNDFFGQEYDEVPAAVGQFEVELGNKAKTVALKTDENKYLGMSGTKVALEDSITDTSSWTVVLANDYCFVENAGNANYYLSYNYQNNKFQVYENGLSGDAFAEVWIDENSTPEVFIDHIELDTTNVQKEFTVGDAFSYVGLVVRTVDELDVKTVVNDYVVIAPDMSSAGQKTVRVTYQDGMFEATYKITVNQKDSGGGSGGGSSGGSSTSDGGSEDSSSAKKAMNLPLVLGLSIGGGVLLLGGAGLVIFLILKKKRKH